MGDTGLEPPGRLERMVATRDPALQDVASRRLVHELLARARANQFDAREDVYEQYVEEFAQLGLELGRRLDVDSNRFSRANAEMRLRAYCGGDANRLVDIRDATVVELGCGGRNPLSVLFAMVLMGARRGVGVDLDTIADVPEVVRALARCAGWMLTDPRLLVGDYPITREQVAANLAASRFDLARLFAGDASGVDQERLTFRNESVYRMGFGGGEVDLCCSTSFLEHVDDADAALAEMARVTKRGGRGAHCIDGTDHRWYDTPGIQPLQFLQEDTQARLVHWCNRIRPRSFVRLFERHGFAVTNFSSWRRQEIDPALRASFAEPFRSMAPEELECVGATLWVERR